MFKRSSAPALSACALILGAGALASIAGELNPPGGPVAPTMKPLDEIEPRTPIKSNTTPGDANSVFRITDPGSYYLIGNVAGTPGKHAIEIAVSGVTIDLRGFSILGVPGSLDGISCDTAEIHDIRITNGTVEDFVEDGIDLGTGSNHHVSAVHAHGNGGDGIHCGRNAIVESCAARRNGRDGILCSGEAGVIRGCTADENSDDGIQLSLSGTISQCAAHLNFGAGILGGPGAAIAECSAYDNVGYGIGVGTRGTINACAADSNGAGIVAGSHTLVRDCSVSANDSDGIRAEHQCIIIGNKCDGNGEVGEGAGIIVSGVRNRIENNNCTDNDWGIRVTNSGNFILRNTCSGNSTLNWEVVAGNKCLVINGVNAGAIAGNSGGTSPGSGNPFANFTY